MTVLIIQARMGSSRLPGKVLKTIRSVPALQVLVERVAKAKTIDKIVVASTTNAEDDAIAALCNAIGVSCFRGSEWDVLERFYKASKPLNADTIVRITSDCFLHDPKVIDFVVEKYKDSGCDYFSNSNHEPDYLEDGFDVEVFSFAALEDAMLHAKLLSEREHVTPYIKNSGNFKCAWKKYLPEYQYKLSVDTQNDFNAVEKIFESFDSLTEFGMIEVYNLLKNNPELRAINAESVINAGYKKSLEQDRTIK